MTQNCTKKLPLACILVTVAISAAMGCILNFLVMVRDNIYSAGANGITAGAAVIIMSGIIICVLMMLIQLLYYYRTRQKTNERNIAMGLKLDARKRDVIKTISKLQEEYTDAEKANRARSRFMARMSHDLRTPMNAILGYSMLIERFSGDRERVNRYADRIRVSGQILMELINDALDMSCIENGNIKLTESEFSLLTALEEVRTAIRPMTESKEQSFRFYITNSAGIDHITGDKQRLCQVLRNVLSNASKYTPERGSVEMTVNLAEDKNGNGRLLCQIKDNGCGMSKEFRAVMFEAFEREDTELNTGVPGTGLGMCIARSFTELMGGEISVESELGKGTVVTVSVPLKLTPECAKNTASEFCETSALKGLNFLVAEDNESNADILNEILNAMGAECTVTEHGRAAIDVFESSEPGQYDAILMDIQMPVMNGYQAAAVIRKSKHPDAQKIKIIAMTADAFEEDVQKAFVSGMDAHVAKPIDLQSFTNTIASLNLKDKNRAGSV